MRALVLLLQAHHKLPSYMVACTTSRKKTAALSLGQSQYPGRLKLQKEGYQTLLPLRFMGPMRLRQDTQTITHHRRSTNQIHIGKVSSLHSRTASPIRPDRQCIFRRTFSQSNELARCDGAKIRGDNEIRYISNRLIICFPMLCQGPNQPCTNIHLYDTWSNVSV